MIFEKSGGAVDWLIVGLGNPGQKYEHTRHNMGFLTVDLLAEQLNVKLNKVKFKSAYNIVRFAGQKCLVMKPQTFMNLSGESIREIVDYYKVDDTSELIVISDDISLDVGQIRIRKKGSAGGHNGLKNIIKMLGHDTFIRVRMGVGEKPVEERKVMDDATKTAAEAIRMILTESADAAMNHFNSKKA